MEFGESTHKYDYGKFYRTRIEALELLQTKMPVKYKGLMRYFNSELFADAVGGCTAVPAHEEEGEELLALLDAGDDSDEVDSEAENDEEEGSGDEGGEGGEGGGEGGKGGDVGEGDDDDMHSD